MEDLRKVGSLQLYAFWKNLSIGLLSVVAILVFSILLPNYFSPIVALIGAAVLYTLLYNNRLSSSSTCMLVPYSMFFCLIGYSFITIIVNILYIWGFIYLPPEFTFFSNPYLPSLTLDPVCFLVMLVIFVRRHKLSLCIDCKLTHGDINERGKLGSILNYESNLQIRNLLGIFAVLTLITWSYYFFIYVDTDVNQRDWYVFVWLNIIVFLLDEVYFIFRYFNLYLDLKENNEIISQAELKDMTAKTYLRFYVICGDNMYVNEVMEDARNNPHKVLDTPFVTKRSVNGITIPEVHSIIRKLTGVRDGEIRFFFGRKNTELANHSVLRYFYFLDGEPSDYPELNVDGKWMSFDRIKQIYSFHTGEMARTMVSDITRMATIILTQKIFNEEGFRKTRLKSYRPSFSLDEVRRNDYDFQDDKWIRISMFNSDTRMYKVKRWWRNALGGGEKKSSSWN